MNNPARPSTLEQRKTLKIAVQIVVNLLGGGKQASKLTAVDPATLSLYGAPHEDERHMRLDVALDLDLAAGEPHVARALASAQGWSLLRDGAPSFAGPLSLADLANLQREAGEAKLSIFDALARMESADLTTGARRAVLKELADLRQAIAKVEAKVEGI